MSCMNSPNLPSEGNHLKFHTQNCTSQHCSSELITNQKFNVWTGFKRDLGKLLVTAILNCSQKTYINENLDYDYVYFIHAVKTLLSSEIPNNLPWNFLLHQQMTKKTASFFKKFLLQSNSKVQDENLARKHITQCQVRFSKVKTASLCFLQEILHLERPQNRGHS